MKRSSATYVLTLSAITAALYAGLCYLLPAISYGAVQVRVSEALVMLPAVLPETIPGLVVGCFLSNLATGNVYDIVFGTLATLLAAVLTAKLPGSLWVKALPPVVLNGVVIGLVLTYGYGIYYFWFNAATVALGEAVACYLLGLPLLRLLPLERVRNHSPKCDKK